MGSFPELTPALRITLLLFKHGAAVGVRSDETVEDCFPFDQGVVLCRCFNQRVDDHMHLVHLGVPAHRADSAERCPVSRHPSPALKKHALGDRVQESAVRSTAIVRSPDSWSASKSTLNASES